MESSRNNSYILNCAVLSSVMKSDAIQLHPNCDVNHPLVQHMCYSLVSQLVASSYLITCLSIIVLMFESPLFYLIMAPKSKQ